MSFSVTALGCRSFRKKNCINPIALKIFVEQATNALDNTQHCAVFSSLQLQMHIFKISL